MLNLFLWSLILVLSASLFEFSYCYGGIDRTFRGLNKAIPETCLVVDGEYAYPYFSKDALQSSVASYFDEALKGYAKSGSYSVDFSYYMADLPAISSSASTEDSSTFSRDHFSIGKSVGSSFAFSRPSLSRFALENPDDLPFPTGARVLFSCPIGLWSHYSNYVDFYVRKGNKYGG
jgi:hypothetical protein